MTYAGTRAIHDADAHIMEGPAWLQDFCDPSWRDRMPALYVATVKPGEEALIDTFARKHGDPAYRAEDKTQLMLRKNWAATGSFLAEDRAAALDLLGFKSQLIFNTFANGFLQKLEQADDVALAYAAATAHNRAIAAFCSADPRLLPVGYVPLADFGEARRAAEQAVGLGCAALMVASACPRHHSPSHIALDPVWAVAQDAGVPVVFHVGGGGQLLSSKYFVNGLPPVPDFHGGAENFRSVDYMAIPHPPMTTLATMIFDGVMDRFPRLMFGVIEQGASWLPGWMRNLDSAFGAFRKNEERLQRLSDRPSGIVRRQLRVTPYPHEDTGWIIAQAGPELCLFSSDYPHVEGGRNPLGRFEAALDDAGIDDSARHRFYFANFVDLMGEVLGRRGLAAVPVAA